MKDKIDSSNLPSIQVKQIKQKLILLEKLLDECEKSQLKLIKRVAEKEELKTAVKHFDKIIKNLHVYIKSKLSQAGDVDDPMLSKK